MQIVTGVGTITKHFHMISVLRHFYINDIFEWLVSFQHVFSIWPYFLLY